MGLRKFSGFTNYIGVFRRLLRSLRSRAMSSKTDSSVIDNGKYVPSRELVFKWFDEWRKTPLKDLSGSELAFVSTRAAQWGADQELQWCCGQIEECYMLTNEQKESVAKYLYWCRRTRFSGDSNE